MKTMTEHKGINLSYLKMLADDHNEAGREATAKDLYVTIDWIKKLLVKAGENNG